MHEEKAVYPKKIQFVNPRPHLALEGLEIFYRIQVCVLKLVLSGCGDEQLVVLDNYVTNALQGHFARMEEKQQKTVEEERSGILFENIISVALIAFYFSSSFTSSCYSSSSSPFSSFFFFLLLLCSHLLLLLMLVLFLFFFNSSSSVAFHHLLELMPLTNTHQACCRRVDD